MMRWYMTFVICVMALVLFAGCGVSPDENSQRQRVDQEEATTGTKEKSGQEENTSELAEPELLHPGEEVKLDTEQEKENEEAGSLLGKVVCLDPGHGITSESGQEKMSPLSDETKPAYVSGASGEYQTEEELNLAVANMIRNRLEELGAKVIMTRTENEATVSNIERAEIANEAQADLCVRIHADGADDPDARGFSILIPGGDNLGTPAIVEPSRDAAEAVEKALAEETGARDRGIVEREDMTGFNWSEVPVILVEMGFLSNPEEDQAMSTDSYRKKLADGITRGIESWLAQ